MSQGIINEDEIKEQPEDEAQYYSINPPVQNKKKDLKQRKKQREQKQLQQARKAVKVEKKKLADIYKLRFFETQIKKIEVKTSLLIERREKNLKLKEFEPKRLSRVPFEPEEIYFNNVTDLSGNLRNLKPEGSVLRDRYKSMQKRNILEPVVKQRVKKAKVKRFTKPGHKDDWMSTVSKAKV